MKHGTSAICNISMAIGLLGLASSSSPAGATVEPSPVDLNCQDLRKKEIDSGVGNDSPFVNEIFVRTFAFDGDTMSIYNIMEKIDPLLSFEDLIQKEKPIARCVNIFTKVLVDYSPEQYEPGYTSRCQNNYTGNYYWPRSDMYEGPVFEIAEARNGISGEYTLSEEEKKVTFSSILQDKSGRGYAWSIPLGIETTSAAAQPAGRAYIFEGLKWGRTSKDRSNLEFRYTRPIITESGVWDGSIVNYKAILLNYYEKTMVIALMRTTDFGFYCHYTPPPSFKF